MSSTSSLLRDFSVRRDASGDLRFLTEEELEDERLSAFEKGYGAGWEDALRSVDKQSAALDDTFRQRIEDLGFTYHEAHAAMMREASSIIDAICRKVLPSVAQDCLGHLISELLADAVKNAGALPVNVITHPDQVASLEDVLASGTSFPINVFPDPHLTLTQAELQFAGQASLVDMSFVTDEILEALEAFCHEAGSSTAQGSTQNVSE